MLQKPVKRALQVPDVMTREAQYAASFRESPVTLGTMASSTWLWDARRLGFVLAHYKFVAKMLSGIKRVAEIGCADGFASAIVADEVSSLDLYDFDCAWMRDWTRSKTEYASASQWDIIDGPLPGLMKYDAIYMLDVLEHISPKDEPAAMRNICASLVPTGTFIAGCPSLESQVHASEGSRAGHVNCKSGNKFRADALKYFSNVFLFGMNDEVLHTGFAPMCHYLLIVCMGPKTDVC